MPERSQRSGRVVIMDDVSWSEPTPRSRRDAELDPPDWVQASDAQPARRSPAPTGDSHRAADDLDAELRDVVGRWQSEMSPELEVIDAGEVDEEQIWGPRPRLMADGSGGRRTVVITGRGADRHVASRTTSRQGPLIRHGFAADRTAMWAVLLCVILLLVALTSH